MAGSPDPKAGRIVDRDLTLFVPRGEGYQGHSPWLVRKRIFGNEDGSVPGQWVDTRNFYSHWDPNSKSNLLENNELIHANVRMRHFLRALYLNLLQVPEDAIQCGVFGSSDDGRFLTHINE